MKQLPLLLMLIASTSLFFLSCQPGTSTVNVKTDEINMDSVKMKIQAMEDEYTRATAAKDVDAVAAYYSNDAQSLANNEPTRAGMDAIKAGIKREMSADTMGGSVVFASTGVWADGKYATETGTITAKNKDGKVNYTGKYMTLFELRDGKYIAIRDIWNDDAPPMASKPMEPKPADPAKKK
ncbi:MAG TPA: DUF4440 domain-containing protein [Saprospiraceae bacterium]|nr:DUF4440 domain-containing protein [Saprospiraceae bacterium]